jgi:hypothetical protein
MPEEAHCSAALHAGDKRGLVQRLEHGRLDTLPFGDKEHFFLPLEEGLQQAGLDGVRRINLYVG